MSKWSVRTHCERICPPSPMLPPPPPLLSWLMPTRSTCQAEFVPLERFGHLAGILYRSQLNRYCGQSFCCQFFLIEHFMYDNIRTISLRHHHYYWNYTRPHIVVVADLRSTVAHLFTAAINKSASYATLKSSSKSNSLEIVSSGADGPVYTKSSTCRTWSGWRACSSATYRMQHDRNKNGVARVDHEQLPGFVALLARRVVAGRDEVTAAVRAVLSGDDAISVHLKSLQGVRR
jgi:hypothetical protein